MRASAGGQRRSLWTRSGTLTTRSKQKNMSLLNKDYLLEHRLKNEANKQEVSRIDKWQSEITRANMNEQEKIDYIKLKSSQLEEEMNRKEKMMKVSQAATLDDAKTINSFLIDSIKTKLNLLNDMS
mmetsp:Transcript_22434/g.25812  ORF Transcript_22434/g.25812 Transcript_22434/m.25812 type:complete len:126 (-) Transcript_22434:23-400(-)